MIRRERIPFVQVENAIIEKGLSAYEMAVYLALCIRSNSDDQAWPSYTTIAKDCGISRRTAMRTVETLIEKNLVERHKRDENSNLYIVKLIGSDSQSLGSDSQSLGSDSHALDLVTKSHPNNNQQNKNKEQYNVHFLKFWDAYPRKVGKKAAYRKWQATLKRESFEGYKWTGEGCLIYAALSYDEKCKKEKTEEKYIKHPATFLGPDEHWRDYLESKRNDGTTRREAKTGTGRQNNSNTYRENRSSGQGRRTDGTGQANAARSGRWQMPSMFG